MASNAPAAAPATPTKTDIATISAGCFWGLPPIFTQFFGNGRGLISGEVGFIGGKDSSPNPSYEEVCTGATDHAEAYQLVYDPAKVSYAQLIEHFYRTHDPTTLNRQGADRGTQYRSAIWPHSQEQLDVARKVTAEVQKKHFDPKGEKIVTIIEQRRPEDFFPADEYHQDYLFKHPEGYHCATHVLHW